MEAEGQMAGEGSPLYHLCHQVLGEPEEGRIQVQWSLRGSFQQGWTPAVWCRLRATEREEMLLGQTQMQHQPGGQLKAHLGKGRA